MSHLANEVKSARKKYKLQSNLCNKERFINSRNMLCSEVFLNNIRRTQKGINSMNEGNSYDFFKNLKNFNNKIPSNTIGTLNWKEQIFEKDRDKAEVIRRIFFYAAHLNGKKFDENFHKQTHSEVNKFLKCNLNNIMKFGTNCELNKRITVEELNAAIFKVKTANQGVDPYNLHHKFLKRFKFNALSLSLHVLNDCLSIGFWPFDKTCVKFLKKK